MMGVRRLEKRLFIVRVGLSQDAGHGQRRVVARTEMIGNGGDGRLLLLPDGAPPIPCSAPLSGNQLHSRYRLLRTYESAGHPIDPTFSYRLRPPTCIQEIPVRNFVHHGQTSERMVGLRIAHIGG